MKRAAPSIAAALVATIALASTACSALWGFDDLTSADRDNKLTDASDEGATHDGGSSDAPSTDDVPTPSDAPAIDAPVGEHCDIDTDCPGDLCNEKLGRCAAPEPNGGPCIRDEECAQNLCNEKLSKCESAEPIAGPCIRDEECAMNLCNEELGKCEETEPVGGPCIRDQECTGTSATRSSRQVARGHRARRRALHP